MKKAVTLTSFLAQMSEHLNTHNVFCFIAAVDRHEVAIPSSLFCTELVQACKRELNNQVQHLDLTVLDTSAVMMQLEAQFLGLSLVYWLGSLQYVDKKTRAWWLEYIVRYQGPHKLLFTLHPQDIPEQHPWFMVNLPATVDRALYSQMCTNFRPELGKRSVAFEQAIFAQRAAVSLDTACLLLSYQQVVGAGTEQFFRQWFSSLAAPEQSLFALSGALLAKQPRQFFEQWAHIKDEYPEPFWVTFWSEQLWRAYFFSAYMRARALAEAKKIAAARLPFSFIQRDWRLIKPVELCRAHQFVYDLDVQFKHGAVQGGIERLYYRYLNNEFLATSA